MKCTSDYTADEQVVILSRYRGITEEKNYREILRCLSGIEERSDRVSHLSYVLYEETGSVVRVIADSEKETGYAYLTEYRGNERITHEALAPVRDASGQAVAYVLARFDSDGVFSREFRVGVPVFVIAALYAAVICVMIAWRLRMEQKNRESSRGSKETQTVIK